ncbi:ATP-binding protein [Streptomyces racemochromogenes]|uniref:ATP-binding protein n=1 Tax=Streptomyces racemochromogenes TaxID=67353 RepID=A0ABW7PDZ6_9ACTN
MGRRRDLEVLEQAARSARRKGAVALVSGEAGVGKTVLLTRCADALRAQGSTVVTGRCPDDAGVPAAWAWTEALGQLARVLPPERVGPLSALIDPGDDESAWSQDLPLWELPGCAYHWNRPVAWLDEDHLVVGGLGDDEQQLVPGARAFRLGRDGSGTVPEEVAAFGGPEGRFFAANGLLFSTSETGTDIRDPATGARTGTLAGFRPTHHDLARGELIEATTSGLRRFRTADAAA